MSHHSDQILPKQENISKLQELEEYNKRASVDWNKLSSESLGKNNPSQQIGKKPEEPGATGEFPEGKFNQDDLGEIQINIGLVRGKVIMNFGKKPVTWIGMTKEQALELSEIIKQKANLIKPVI